MIINLLYATVNYEVIDFHVTGIVINYNMKMKKRLGQTSTQVSHFIDANTLLKRYDMVDIFFLWCYVIHEYYRIYGKPIP